MYCEKCFWVLLVSNSLFLLGREMWDKRENCEHEKRKKNFFRDITSIIMMRENNNEKEGESERAREREKEREREREETCQEINFSAASFYLRRTNT